jgi:hypothetical protein
VSWKILVLSRDLGYRDREFVDLERRGVCVCRRPGEVVAENGNETTDPNGIRTTTACSWLSPRSLILQSTTGSERLAQREDPFKLGADVKGEGLAASPSNLDLACARVPDLVEWPG